MYTVIGIWCNNYKKFQLIEEFYNLFFFLRPQKKTNIVNIRSKDKFLAIKVEKKKDKPSEENCKEQEKEKQKL